MKTYMKYFLAVTVIFAIGIVAAGTVTAAEEPIWRNFIKETTVKGTLPDEANFKHNAPIWQAQLDTLQKASLEEQVDGKSFPVALAETTPIWCDLAKCL